jgi:hypothetical protein
LERETVSSMAVVGSRPALPVPAGVPLPHQVAVLEYRMDGTVATHDDPPAPLGRMPPAFIAQLGPRLRAGRLLRFRIGPGGVYFQDGAPVGGWVGRGALFRRRDAMIETQHHHSPLRHLG